MTLSEFAPGKVTVTLEEMKDLYGKEVIEYYDYLITAYIQKINFISNCQGENSFDFCKEKRIFLIVAEYDEQVARDDFNLNPCRGIRYFVRWAYPFLSFVDYMNPRFSPFRSDFNFSQSSVINESGDGYIEFNLGFIERFDDGKLSSRYFDVFIKGIENIHAKKNEVFTNHQSGTDEIVGDVYSTMKIIKEAKDIVSDYSMYLNLKTNFGWRVSKEESILRSKFKMN